MTHSDAFPGPFFCSPETLAGFFAFFSFAENVHPRPNNLKFSINLLKNQINLCCIKDNDAAVRPQESHNNTGGARFQQRYAPPDMHCQSIMKYYLLNILPDLQSYLFVLWISFVFPDKSRFVRFHSYHVSIYYIFLFYNTMCS